MPITCLQIAIPNLHIDLGVFTMLFHSFEEESKSLDVTLAEADMSNTGGEGKFVEVVQQQQRKMSLLEQAAHREESSSSIMQQLAWLMVNSDCEEMNAAGQAAVNALQLSATQMQEEAAYLQQQAAEIVLPTSIANGPCTQLLDTIHQQHDTDRQPYHGCTFQGDHAHKALKVNIKRKFGGMQHGKE